MSKKFKFQASSARAASGAFGSPAGGFGSFAGGPPNSSSSLSYVAEPPDLSRISEPQVVVAFKNVSKKDSVTKAKALEDLQEYISTPEAQDGGVGDGILEAWVGLLARTYVHD